MAIAKGSSLTVEDKLKQSNESLKHPKVVLVEIYSSSGDVYHPWSLSQLPRGPRDIYNARAAAKKVFKLRIWNGSFEEQDEVWVILGKAKKEAKFSELKFMRDFKMYPSLSVVLSSESQLDDAVNFCTTPKEYSVFIIDPTVNIFNDNISLTVTNYRNLKLENPSTGQALVFLSPLLMHQKKDWKIYSRFANCLVTENPEISALLACGTDEEKAIVDGFKRNVPYAILLRCFIHYKKNMEEHLENRWFSKEWKKLFLDEIFGVQNRDKKFCGLVDCSSEEEFDQRISALKSAWNAREDNMSELYFRKWFITEKVNILEI